MNPSPAAPPSDLRPPNSDLRPPSSAPRPPSHDLRSPNSDLRTPRAAAALTFALAFAASTALAAWFAHRSGLGAFTALAALSSWALFVTLATRLPPLRFHGRTLLLALGTAAVLAGPLRLALAPPNLSAGATDATLQLAAVVGATLAFLLHFLGVYATHTARETGAPAPGPLVPLARALALAQLLVVAALLTRLYAQRNLLAPLQRTLLAVLALLVAEAALHALAHFYQPRRQRAAGHAFGHSLLLPAVFGESGPLRSLLVTLEKTFGVDLTQTWLVRLARAAAAPLLLAAALGLWASTAVTAIPVDSRGVLENRGAFAATSLPPGLHWHAPWPWARVHLVPTGRVQEIALGFERDLAGPVLWAEKHFDGEQNLLVGSGEELLTLNVPVHYRIRDAVAYLRHTADARAALEDLGYRELLALTTSHSAFGLMTTDRVAIADQLRDRLQLASDRLGLGLQIVFVGLKDVHPPVPVAPAYQDVISAEEQRVALVDQARSYQVDTLAAARSSETDLRIRAETAATSRLARAAGESARFLAPLAVYHAAPEVYATRLRLDSIESALADLRQLIVVPSAATAARANLYLGLDPTTLR